MNYDAGSENSIQCCQRLLGTINKQGSPKAGKKVAPTIHTTSYTRLGAQVLTVSWLVGTQWFEFLSKGAVHCALCVSEQLDCDKPGNFDNKYLALTGHSK